MEKCRFVCVSGQEWKAHSPLFEGYPKYTPDFQQNTAVDLKDFPLRFAQVTHDPSKKGVKQFQISAVEEAPLVPLVPVEDVQPWCNEPTTLEELLDRYIVENKMPASVAGGMLYLTKAATRAGELVDVVPEQKHKLFLAPGE
eukprot:s10_g16.t1